MVKKVVDINGLSKFKELYDGKLSSVDGATGIGIKDISSKFIGDNVESALNELKVDVDSKLDKSTNDGKLYGIKNGIIEDLDGIIITEEERAKVEISLDNDLQEDYIFIGDNTNKAISTPLLELILPVFISCIASEDLQKGNPIYISGTHTSGKPEVSIADSSDPSKMPSYGLVSSDVLSGEDVNIQANGILEGLDTSMFSTGQALYVNGDGVLSTEEPSGDVGIQKIGAVSRSHASNGSIIIQGAGRINALPNLLFNHIWIGDVDGKAMKFDLVSELTRYLKKDGTDAMANNLNLATNKIINVGTPVDNADATTKLYVDNKLNEKSDLDIVMKKDGSTPLTGILNMSNNKVINVGTPTSNNDAVTMEYVDIGLEEKAEESEVLKKDGSVQLTGNLDFNGSKAINISIPTLSSDVANKGYVDNATAGSGSFWQVVDYHHHMDDYALPTGFGDGSTDVGTLIIDPSGANISIADMNEGDRILIVSDIADIQCGIYVVNSDNSTSRSVDANDGSEFTQNKTVFIINGGSHAGTTYGFTGNTNPTLGTTPILFEYKSGTSVGDGTIDSNKLANNSVITSKINNLAITGEKIQSLTITTDKLIDSAVTTDKIEDSAITSAKYSDTSIARDKIDSSFETDISNLENNKVESIVAGANITINSSDPKNPIISSTGGGDGGGGVFTKYTVEVSDSPYTIPNWDTVLEVHNENGSIELILPVMTSEDQGKEIKAWIKHNTANNKVIFKAPNETSKINDLMGASGEVAKAEINSNNPNFARITAQIMDTNSGFIDGVDTVYNVKRYIANFSATSDFSPYSYLTLSSVPSGFYTRDSDWWYAVKIESPMKNDSDGQVLFGSNSFFTAYRGDGTYFMTSSTSRYLQSISPNTIVESGEWIIYQHRSSNNYYDAWINGVKVLNNTSSGTTPPSSSPTSMWFGSETGQSSATSGYGYPINTCKISTIAIGDGLLTDVDASLFTNSMFNPNSDITLTGGNVTNQWSFDESGALTELGSIDLTLVGNNLSTEEI